MHTQSTAAIVPVLKTIPDAARDWFGNVSTRHVYQMIKDEKLRVTRLGRRVFIADDDARKTIEKARRKQKAA